MGKKLVRNCSKPKKMYALVFCLLGVSVAMAAHLPDGVVPCKLGTADYNECASREATKALRKLAHGDKRIGFPNIEPLLVEKLEIENSGFQHKYTDIKIHKLSTATITDVIPNFEGSNCGITVNADLDEVIKEGKYTATGKLLLFTLNGVGNYRLKLEKIKVSFDAKCERQTRDGAIYLNLLDLKMKLDPSKVIYEYENLFNGKPDLSAEILKVMNENDLEVYEEVRNAYQDGLAAVFKVVINTLFNHVSMEEAFPR